MWCCSCLTGRMNDFIEISLDDNCTFVVDCSRSNFTFINVTLDPGFSHTMIPCNSPFSVMLNRTNTSITYDYTVEASDGCLAVVIRGEAGMRCMHAFCCYQNLWLPQATKLAHEIFSQRIIITWSIFLWSWGLHHLLLPRFLVNVVRTHECGKLIRTRWSALSPVSPSLGTRAIEYIW